jgi:hypothetical protein
VAGNAFFSPIDEDELPACKGSINRRTSGNETLLNYTRPSRRRIAGR